MLTELLLSQIMPHASQARRRDFLPHLDSAMQKQGINNLPRAAAFLAQLAHESGELQFMEEIWGPTAAQNRYEPKTSLSAALGNEAAGDGKRFKGRGPIQITGRANYSKYGKAMNVDFESSPELAARPEHGFAIAGLYWKKNGLNELADAGDFRQITRRINGGFNGLAEREAYYRRAKAVLASAFPAATAAARASKPKPKPEFTRGMEGVAKVTRSPARAVTTLDARADGMDFRDLMYVPSLVEVPTHVPLGDYLDHDVPVLDQGNEGACTGFGLATVANYLLRRRRVVPDLKPVSPWMFYRLARRYDEWPGEDYSGSSARGAMKGWNKHGVCGSDKWGKHSGNGGNGGLTSGRAHDACTRPLGAYFRVNHRDLIAMHSAIAEVGVLYATSSVHSGWDDVDESGYIVQSDTMLGGHAFAIVAYDDHGFWIQNSWGTGWGKRGFGRISYDDWLQNGTDVWVARLGSPVILRQPESTATAHARGSAQSAAYSYAQLRQHIVSVGNNGALKAGGDYGGTPSELAQVFEDDIPKALKGWAKPKLLLYAHGGLVSEQAAVQRLAEYRPTLLEAQVYPLAFIWRTDYWTTISNILQDAVRRRRPEGALDAAKDFMLDRLDDALEPLARAFTGKSVWTEMKENARLASQGGGAAVLVADHIKALAKAIPGLEIHLVGHSAGSIFHGPMIKLLTDRKLKIETCTLWAPACTVELFNQDYLPAIQAKTIRHFALFALRDDIERDDNCAKIYNKSLLYLVSNAFEAKARIPMFRDGVPILGMEKFLTKELRAKLAAAQADIVLSPNGEPLGSHAASEATHHGDFDDDEKTVTAT
ncbi:MAG: glycoside hydrolase family 19 protein, partial [Pseudoxanthomonas sp.]